MASIFRVTLNFCESLQSPAVICYIHNNDILNLVLQYGNGEKARAAAGANDTYAWRTLSGHTMRMEIEDIEFDKNGSSGYLEFSLETNMRERNPRSNKYNNYEASCAYDFDKDRITTLTGIEEKLARRWIA